MELSLNLRLLHRESRGSRRVNILAVSEPPPPLGMNKVSGKKGNGEKMSSWWLFENDFLNLFRFSREHFNLLRPPFLRSWILSFKFAVLPKFRPIFPHPSIYYSPQFPILTEISTPPAYYTRPSTITVGRVHVSKGKSLGTRGRIKWSDFWGLILQIYI